MKIAFVGTGFVADYYMTTLNNYPNLSVAGAWDSNSERLTQFCDYYQVHPYADLSELLAEPELAIVINLATPESHFAVNLNALEAGKHVYCEKPLAMDRNEAEELVLLAGSKELLLCAAPANALSDAFNFVSALLASDKIGRPGLVYAEMEDGPVYRANWQDWKSRSGAAWPGIHEFEIGCTLEHAGYGLSWLVGLFGPVKHLQSFAALTFPDKGPGTRDLKLAPDFSVGCLTFENGVVARLTNGLAAPRDRSFTVMGDEGTLVVRDLWDNRSPIQVAKDNDRTLVQKVANRIEHRLGRTLPFRMIAGRKMPYPKPATGGQLPDYPSQIDFARGIAIQANAIEKGERPFFSGHVALHLTELALALSAGETDYTPKTRFDFNLGWADDSARLQ